MLLADEPTGNVDPPLAKPAAPLRRTDRTGTAVLIATHDLSLLDQVEARHLFIRDGGLTVTDPHGGEDGGW